MNVAAYLLIANGLLSTTYGHGEKMCGDIGKARPCTTGAVTASSVVFNTEYPMVAVAAPSGLSLRHKYIGIRLHQGPCVSVLLSDKMNPRYIGIRGFDLSPAAVKKLTGAPASPRWSDKVYLCEIKDEVWQSLKVLNVARSLQPLSLEAARLSLKKRLKHVKPPTRPKSRPVPIPQA